MAVTQTLLNWRESAVPESTTFEALGIEPVVNASGQTLLRTMIRQYKFVVQVLIEGATRDVLQQLQEYTGVLGEQSLAWPASLDNIQVDEENFFVPDVDLNEPETVRGLVIKTVTEITGNYSKEQYGKLSFTLSLEGYAPQEWFNGVTGEWDIIYIDVVEEPAP